MIIKDRAALHEKLDTVLGLYRQEGMPQNAHLDITYRCDLDCVHCYLDEKNEWPEMKTKEWLSVLDQLAELGVWELGWSGGEVFARPDFQTLLQHASDLGFRNRVKTHAGNVDEALARRMAEMRVWRVDVSVYSLDAGVHDGITGVPGSLAATLKGIDALLTTDIKIRVSVSVFRSNFFELEDMDAHFHGLGASPTFSTTMFPDQSGSAMLDDLQLTGEELSDAERRIMAMRKKVVPMRELQPKRFGYSADVCGAGRSLIYVSPDGAVWPCVQFPMSLGNLRENSLLEIWRDSEERKKLVAFTNNERTGCKDCSGNTMCFYCPGEAYRRTGDFKKAPDVFHMRTVARMHAYRDVLGMPLDDDDFASVPKFQTKVLTEPKRKFVFPIYRPEKKGGQRVKEQTAEHSP